jgi:Methane oxygenase PmoA
MTTSAAPLTTAGLKCDDDGATLSFSIGQKQLVRYTYRPADEQYESPRPYFHPINTLGGDTVSILRPWDHLWHKGISWALPNVGKHNFWGGATYTRQTGYANLDNNGAMRHDAFEAVGPSGNGIAATESLTWTSQQGKEVMAETRSFSVQLLQDAWALLFETTMTNISGARLDIGSPTTEGRDNAGYGGLFWRGPRSFTGGEVISPDGHVVEDSAEALRGSRAEWLAFTGQHDEHARHSGLTFLEDRSNPGFPNQWFVRSEPFACLGSAPFFSEVVALPDGESLKYRFAIVVSDGKLDAARATAHAEAGRAALEDWGSTW